MAAGFEYAIRGRYAEHMAAESAAAKRAGNAVISQRARRLKRRWQARLEGEEIANLAKYAVGLTIKRENTVDPQAVVFDRAQVKRASGVVKLVSVFDRGALIRPGGGRRYLALPILENVGRRDVSGRARPLTPADYEKQLIFIPITRGIARVEGAKGRRASRLQGPAVRFALLIHKDTKKPMFLLVPATRIAPVLNLEREYRRVTRDLSAAIVRRWEREAQKRGLETGA